MDQLDIIGRAERIDFPELNLEAVPARVDTGAKTSALCASMVTEKNGLLEVVLFGESSPFYTGKPVIFEHFKTAIVASSNGHAEERYKIRTVVVVNGRKIRASFTLADRTTQVYPVLVGRNILAGKFMVNVKVGTPLIKEEKVRELTKARVARKLNRQEGKNS